MVAARATLGSIRLAELLSLSGDGDPVLDRMRAEQMTQVVRFLPWTALTTMLHALALWAALRAGPDGALVDWWLGAQTLILLSNVIIGLRYHRCFPLARVGARPMRGMAVGAALQALVWNAMLLAALPAANEGQTVMIAATQLAMIAAGAFFFGAAPLAALTFTLIFTAAHAAMSAASVMQGMGSPVVLVLISTIGFVVCRGIVVNAAALARQVRATEELREQSDTISMLLNEFEQTGRDWIWRCDAQLTCTHLSARFNEVVGRPTDGLIGRHIFDTPWRAINEVEVDKLTRALETRQTFRNVELVVEVAPDDHRWWSFSATPRYDARGAFAGYLGVGSDVTAHRRAQAQVERMARCDALTGLANRVRFADYLQAALDAARADGGRCALALIDLDRFKLVNDTLGHPTGDALLREVAARLVATLGAAGSVARLGGDEFAVVLPGADEAAALAAVTGAIAALSEPYLVGGATLRIGASAGVAQGGRDGVAVDALLRAADLALYRAKNDGRGVARAFDQSLQREADERSQLETALRVALREGQLALAFQPIYHVGSGRVRAFEALLRWHHPELGAISPARFIPIAEDLGLINAIGAWVIETACAWAARWPEDVGVAVNLSPSQLADADLPGVVADALARHDMTPARLELEITENVFLNEDAATRAALARLAALGVRFGLDDFGTGYSSLGYLRSSVFNTIKIDRSFVRDAVDAQSQSAEIVRHIVSLARSLGMSTVAEGAETRAEMDAVRALGCEHVQGYYCGRPMSPEDAVALVAPAARAA